MILVDTSVWIDHLRTGDIDLRDKLRSGQVLMHPMILGELACGNLPERAETLRRMRSLPQIEEMGHDLVHSQIDRWNLKGRGIGFIDAHLISSVLERGETLLWTRDKRLKRVAEDLRVAFSDQGARRQ